MPKINVNVSFRLNLGNYQHADYSMGVSSIDTDAPLEPQLAASEAYLTKTSAWIEQQLFERLRENNLVETIRARKP